MPISLKKGQRVDLTKTNPGLKEICVGLGWDVNKYDGGSSFDLDTAAFLLGGNDKVRQQGDFVFYGNLSHESGAVVHQGDNLTGEGEGDDEQIVISTNQGEPLVGTDAMAGKAYANICKRLLGEEVPFLDLDKKENVFTKLASLFK